MSEVNPETKIAASLSAVVGAAAATIVAVICAAWAVTTSLQDTLRYETGKIREDIAAVRSTVESLIAGQSANATAVAMLGPQLQKLEDVATRLEDVASDVNQSAASVGTINERLSSMAEKQEQFIARLSRLESNLEDAKFSSPLDFSVTGAIAAQKPMIFPSKATRAPPPNPCLSGRKCP